MYTAFCSKLIEYLAHFDSSKKLGIQNWEFVKPSGILAFSSNNFNHNFKLAMQLSNGSFFTVKFIEFVGNIKHTNWSQK